MAEDTPTLVNQNELAELLDVSLPTLRALIRDSNFPVVSRGSNGIAYEFDAASVARWKSDNADRLEAERVARADELAEMKLDLFGGMTVDPARAGMSPRDQAAAIAAEIAATNLARSRRELVPATEVAECLGRAFGILRREMMDIAALVSQRHGLDRIVRASLDAAIRAALTKCAALVADLEIKDNARAA